MSTDGLLLPKRFGDIAPGIGQADLPLTYTLDPDEKFFKLTEVNRIDTTSRHVRRWEFIYVQRDGNLHVHVADMGSAELFQEPELEVYGLWEETVAWGREQADDMRFHNSLRKSMQERADEPKKLFEVWLKYKSELWEQKQNRSVMGPAFTRQRNAFVRGRK